MRITPYEHRFPGSQAGCHDAPGTHQYALDKANESATLAEHDREMRRFQDWAADPEPDHALLIRNLYWALENTLHEVYEPHHTEDEGHWAFQCWQCTASDRLEEVERAGWVRAGTWKESLRRMGLPDDNGER